MVISLCAQLDRCCQQICHDYRFVWIRRRVAQLGFSLVALIPEIGSVLRGTGPLPILADALFARTRHVTRCPSSQCFTYFAQFFRALHQSREKASSSLMREPGLGFLVSEHFVPAVSSCSHEDDRETCHVASGRSEQVVDDSCALCLRHQKPCHRRRLCLETARHFHIRRVTRDRKFCPSVPLMSRDV